MINFEKRPATLFLFFLVLATTSCAIAQATKTETAANKSVATQDATAPAAAGKDTAVQGTADDDADADLAAMDKSATKPATKSADKSSAPKAEDDPQQKQIKQLRADAELRNEQLSAKLASLKAENDQLRLANEVAQQKQTQALQQLQAEKGKLEAELALLGAKDSTAAAPDKAKIESLQRAQKLRDAQLTDELSGLSAEQNRLKQNQDVNTAKLQAELAANKAELERAKVAEDMLDMKSRVKIANLKREQDQISAENGLAAEKRRAEQSKIIDEQMRATAMALTVTAQITNRDAEDKWRDAVNAPPTYTMEPFKDGVLTISDRKIELDGPIVTGTADNVCDRIDYFNNQDRTKPIFVVINNSPGGSVMQGYRILKAIETSDAPVHVVVRSFAASMAATIATLAPHSYAYPNAIILHHQMSGGAVGNMTDMEQELKTMQEWERRLAEPIAKKMGISLDEFKAKMYAAKKSGDWDEFADKALQLHWIDNIVNEIREEGIRKKPTENRMPSWMFMMKKDDKGNTYMSLPPLEPYDCYFMINPRNFYRVDGR
jgi:ATP-dependent Clp protease, protease subunit